MFAGMVDEAEGALLAQVEKEVLRVMTKRAPSAEEMEWVIAVLPDIPLMEVEHLPDLLHLFKNGEKNGYTKGLGYVVVPGNSFAFVGASNVFFLC
jgi:hypothetical protein